MTAFNILRARLLLLTLAVGSLLVPAAPALAGALDWLPGTGLKGSGTIVKQTRALPAFTGVSLSMGGQVALRLGNSEDITLETDDNILPAIETVVENGM